MRQDNMHEALMKSAIHVVAEQGIHKTTTKALAQSSGVNEAYIYRLFGGKEDLLKKTFAVIDAELMQFLAGQMNQVLQESSDAEQSTAQVVTDFWHYILADREKCLFFIRYYYSHHYHTDYSPAERRAIYRPVIDRLSNHLVEGADAWEEINHVYDVVFPMASRVLRGEIKNSTALEESICRRVFAVLEPLLISDNMKEEG